MKKKIFDKEYIYLNNIANIILSKIINILILSILIFVISLISVYYLNQNIQDEHKWVIKYNEPNPSYDVKKIIKSIDKAERDLGYNVERYHYTPDYIIFKSFFNFIKKNNENKIFESEYKLKNSINREIVKFRYKIFMIELFGTTELIVEIFVNDEEISKDYVKKFKNFYETKYIDQIKDFYPKLLKENIDKLQNDLQSELLESELNLYDFIVNNQNNQNFEIVNNYKNNIVNSINDRYGILITQLENNISNIKKENFSSLFLTSTINPKPVIIKKQISYFLTGSSGFVLGFLFSCLIFLFLEFRKNKITK
tara:strand:+ start:234 stop:1166 length:933 start_codon:yes stop_codon:yes gene_type:complete